MNFWNFYPFIWSYGHCWRIYRHCLTNFSKSIKIIRKKYGSRSKASSISKKFQSRNKISQIKKNTPSIYWLPSLRIKWSQCCSACFVGAKAANMKAPFECLHEKCFTFDTYSTGRFCREQPQTTAISRYPSQPRKQLPSTSLSSAN